MSHSWVGEIVRLVFYSYEVMFNMKTQKLLFLFPLFLASAVNAEGNKENCSTLIDETSQGNWWISFASDMEHALPYFTDGKERCYIGRDISLESLENFRFHAVEETRDLSDSLETIYDITIDKNTQIESLKFNAIYSADKFRSLAVYLPSNKLFSGMLTQSINWRDGRNLADSVKPADYPYPFLSDDFLSGNAGQHPRQKTDFQTASITLRNDSTEESFNDIPKWRNWWYVSLSGVFIDSAFTFNIDDAYPSDNRGWEYDYTPIYSYDNKTWQRFELDDLKETLKEDAGTVTRTIQITKKFTENKVWLSRFYPYSTDDFDQFYAQLLQTAAQGTLTKETLGYSPVLNKPIELVTMTNPAVPEADKKRVWIHTRTHSAETGGSFLVEGLMNFLASDDPNAKIAMDNLIFHIVPVHNPDGVNAGNYRLNGKSENLEVLWLRDPNDPWYLSAEAPVENQILNAAMRNLTGKEGEFTLALNLHSSQSERGTRPFFFPHFGPSALGYNTEESALWDDSIKFIDFVKHYYGKDLIEPSPTDGGRTFVPKGYPESWWWANFKNSVMALTLETTYDQAGYAPDYVNQEKYRELGKSLGMAALAYHNLLTPVLVSDTPTLRSKRSLDPVSVNSFILDEAASKE